MRVPKCMHAIPHVNWILFPTPPDVLLSFNCSSSRIIRNLYCLTFFGIPLHELFLNYYIIYQIIFGHLYICYNLYDELFEYNIDYYYISLIIIIIYEKFLNINFNSILFYRNFSSKSIISNFVYPWIIINQSLV